MSGGVSFYGMAVVGAHEQNDLWPHSDIDIVTSILMMNWSTQKSYECNWRKGMQDKQKPEMANFCFRLDTCTEESVVHALFIQGPWFSWKSRPPDISDTNQFQQAFANFVY